MFENKKIMVLCPHVDDGEYGAGGTIARAIYEGAEVCYVSFSFAQQSLLEGYVIDDIKDECKASCELLNIQHTKHYNYITRDFPKQRQLILEKMVMLNKRFSPDIVFTPSTCDTHQDHKVICEESFRAFKKCSILGYEMLRNNVMFNGSFFVELNLKHLMTKISALECYKSQLAKKQGDIDFLSSLARTRGAQIYRKCAECFEVIRWIGGL